MTMDRATEARSGAALNSFIGKRVLTTRTSSELGLEFADLPAAQKVNLVLVARRQGVQQ